MAKMTIAQLREREVKRLKALKGCKPYNVLEKSNKTYWKALETSIDDCKEEKKILNQFYRLSALSERIVNLENDGRLYNKERVSRLEEKEKRAINRLKTALKNYGLTVDYCGIYPSIVKKDKNGGVIEVINRWYY